MAAHQSSCYLILSLDGGGIRGALQARIIERLENDLPFLSGVKLIAGSSIGGINALCLAAGGRPSNLVELFKDRAEDIFKTRDWMDLIVGPADEVFRADFGSDGLEEILEEFLGEKTLGDLDKRVTITSFDLDNSDPQSRAAATRVYKRRFWKVKIFHNFDSEGNDKSQLATDVGLRTSAAPTYFPSHQGYVDGGLVANNPSLCGLARAVKSGINQDQIVMVSIGTGRNPKYIEGDRLDWGFKQWLPHLFPLLMDGTVGLPDYICEQLLPNRYVRINPFLPEDVDLAAVDRVDDLIEWANDVDLGPTIDLLASLPA
jgi:patatin-like phospholipase/acyl hydrolase